MFPTCTSRSRQTFRSSRARTGSSMHSAAAVAHRGSQTLFAFSRPCPTSGGVVRVPWGIAIFQPSYWRSIGSIIPSHHRHLCLRNCVDSRAPRSPAPLYEHGRVRQSFSARKASTSSTSITMEKRTSPSRLRTGQPIRAASLPSLLENPLRATASNARLTVTFCLLSRLEPSSAPRIILPEEYSSRPTRLAGSSST